MMTITRGSPDTVSSMAEFLASLAAPVGGTFTGFNELGYSTALRAARTSMGAGGGQVLGCWYEDSDEQDGGR